VIVRVGARFILHHMLDQLIDWIDSIDGCRLRGSCAHKSQHGNDGGYRESEIQRRYSELMNFDHHRAIDSWPIDGAYRTY
jgi:hypothetical protein